MPPLSVDLGRRLLELADNSSSTRESHERRDSALEYERLRAAWVANTCQAWRRGLAASVPAGAQPLALADFTLIDDDVVEKKIISSRLAMAIQEHVSWEWSDLKARLQHLQAGEPLAPDDVLRPEGLSMMLVEQWLATGLPRRTWLLGGDVVQQHLMPAVAAAYKRLNELLVTEGVMPQIDLSSRVRRAHDPGVRAGRGGGAGAAVAAGSSAWSGGSSQGRFAGTGSAGRMGVSGSTTVPDTTPNTTPDRPSSVGAARSSRSSRVPSALAASGDSGFDIWDDDLGDGLSPGAAGSARLRGRTQGVLGQVRRLLAERVSGYDPISPAALSSGLMTALTQVATVSGGRSTLIVARGRIDDASVAEVAQELRERTGELKRQATSQSEKALIEIVALMFQSILAEERLPPSVRVWFARLQIPVLRVALAEPEFFESLQHPARLLIDRMGACALGFDAAAIDGSELEAEIRRVVQLIEQYPDTGRKVFLLAYEEFQKFLSRFLTDKDATRHVVSVAQQVEQKETMAVRYTIELRKMLDDMPVPTAIREFLFKVWAEVLAVAAVRQGGQHEETVALRKAAAELVWAASAKPDRSERAQVIQGLPALLQRLRQGMGLLGMTVEEQDGQLKYISETLAEAFRSKTAAIPNARIEAITEQLGNLETFAGDTDLPLDAEALEMVLGRDAQGITVITDGGVKPGSAAQAWARELQPGAWFALDHSGECERVQYAWRSERGHLHLFTTAEGGCYLLQAGRLAAYLQAGLIVPTEDEALTVRATRDALAKLGANPERLLA